MANASFDFIIENIKPEVAEVLMDFINLYAKSHSCTLGGGYLMVDNEGNFLPEEVPDVQDA